MKKSDEGTYHCQAENSAGPKISESIHVEVQGTLFLLIIIICACLYYIVAVSEIFC